MSTIKIGVHANNPALFLLSHLDLADRALAPLGVEVRWHRYTGGTDDGRAAGRRHDRRRRDRRDAADLRPGRGLPVVYVAHSDPRPAHGTLLVTPDSDVQRVDDLRGRRVALGIGSWQTLLLAVALDRAGIALRRGRGGPVRPGLARAAAGRRARRVDRPGARARRGDARRARRSSWSPRATSSPTRRCGSPAATSPSAAATELGAVAGALEDAGAVGRGRAARGRRAVRRERGRRARELGGVRAPHPVDGQPDRRAVRRRAAGRRRRPGPRRLPRRAR